MYNRKISVAEKILANAAKRNDIKLCSNFKIRPINHKVCLQKSFYPFQIPYDFHYFIISYANFFFQAYNSLDETTTCLSIISTHNIRVIFLLATIFWNLYHFLWSSLYVRMFSEENVNYLLFKVFCSLAVLACLTIFSSLKLTLRHLLLAHILITGAFTAGVMFFRKVSIVT